MSRNFREALAHRRSYYNITNSSPISDEEIKDILESVVKNTPSAFNSQSTRVVLLLSGHHKKFWEITKSKLKEIVSSDAYPATEGKIDGCFAAGYGTVLFFEDKAVVEGLQNAFPLYKDNFPIWSHHTSAMHQLAVWTMLEDKGLGASLQHYSPLVDSDVYKEWNINPNWQLIAQMPFGTPTKEPDAKEMKPLKDRLVIFK
ncbi:MAG: nitroreductase family protein [Phocaeicola sp.]